MHQGNIDWLRDLDQRFRAQLSSAYLLELGSLDVNGSAREHLYPLRWTGVDREPGPGVDIVCDATDTSFPRHSFDVLLCTSMLEHDRGWRYSLERNLRALRPLGLVFLSWGAEGNQHHAPEPWEPVPVHDVRRWAEGLIIVDECWERDRYTPDCLGCYDMVLQKPARPGIRLM